jgi:drug/metabolite transporter (DMT)-like permease
MSKSKLKNNIFIFLFLHILLCFFSLSGVFSKRASAESFLSLRFIAFYSGVILILGVYAICWQQIIKRMHLSVAYANKAVTVIWGLLWGTVFFNEQITPRKILGAVIVVIGVVLYSVENMHERS